MKISYSEMKNSDFMEHLEKVIDFHNRHASQLLNIPGIYEILSEYYNNDVLDSWAESQKKEIDKE